MIQLPEFNRSFDYENGFYLSCDSSRIAKFLAHYELFKMVQEVPGAIVECGVFKGVSLTRFAMLRELFGPGYARTLVGFDIFGRFPETAFEPDRTPRKQFVDAAGDESISVEQMKNVLEQKKCGQGVELIAGNVCETVPKYASENPELRIALLNLDTDMYEPAVTILEHFWPRISMMGILILDDYGVFPGETKAVDEYFKGNSVKIRKFPFCKTPCYVVKGCSGL